MLIGIGRFTAGPTPILPTPNTASGTAISTATAASPFRSRATSGKARSTFPACNLSAGSCSRRRLAKWPRAISLHDCFLLYNFIKPLQHCPFSSTGSFSVLLFFPQKTVKFHRLSGLCKHSLAYKIPVS